MLLLLSLHACQLPFKLSHALLKTGGAPLISMLLAGQLLLEALSDLLAQLFLLHLGCFQLRLALRDLLLRLLLQ